LGEYFQYITRDGAEEVPLEKEAHHARTYMEIQTIRFGHRINVHFGAIPVGVGDILVPRLILQPIIENAYNHSLEKKVKDGQLSVEMSLSPVELIIAIQDNGNDLTDEKIEQLQMILHDGAIQESTGMINVHRRLKIKYGEAGGLRLNRGIQGGLKVEIFIPITKRLIT
jgi:two-component system sensor histidine kinase YesM